MSEVVDHTPQEQPVVDVPIREQIEIRLTHWEQRLVETERARQIALGQVASLRALKEKYQEEDTI